MSVENPSFFQQRLWKRKVLYFPGFPLFSTIPLLYGCCY